MDRYPSAWQKKILWSAITAVALLTIGASVVLVLWLSGEVLAFLQPLLIPVAVAGVMAYLLEPAVQWLCKKGMSRLRAVLTVFGIGLLSLTLIGVWVVPNIYAQSVNLAKKLPGYTTQAREYTKEFLDKNRERFTLLPSLADMMKPDESDPAENGTEAPSDEPEPTQGESPAESIESSSGFVDSATVWIEEKTPELVSAVLAFLGRSIGGFLGVFGFLLGFILVPLYLFFFLKDAARISQSWSNYLPLKASNFKEEVVDCLTEINGYLINFFRGQLLVSMIDGVLTAVALLVMGLDFAILIGLMVAVLALIPFIGILLCWLPAVIIALAQWPGELWAPLAVTAIFIAIQQIEGIFISPKIVGDSVGLHPMTVIVSMVAWSLLLGGLLGAILAVPLTATLKVLLKRYVWEQRIKQKLQESPPSPSQ